MNFQIFIEGKHYGQMDLPAEFRSGKFEDKSGIAFFCPVCARIWAVVYAEGHESYPYSIGCEQHPRFAAMPAGSIMLPWDRAWNAKLPRAVIQRELLIHIKHYERYKDSYDH